MNRQNRTVTPGGTIARTVHDVRSQVTETWLGTDDTLASESDPAGGGATGNNMVQITANVYDAGFDGGNGNLTQLTEYVDASGSIDRVTGFVYDFRDRQTATNGEVDFYQETTYDNLDRVTLVERYDTNFGGNLIAKGETFHDDRGQVYRTVTTGVNPTNGDENLNPLTDNTYRDGSNNVIKSQPAGSDAFTITTYDGLNRPTLSYVAYLDASDFTIVFEQVSTSYDAGGNVTETAALSRYEGSTSTDPLTAGTNARPAYSASWYDGVGRTVAGAAYGNQGQGNDSMAFTRPTSPPDSSDTILVGTTIYNSGGKVSSSIDPAGIENRQEYDNSGRTVRSIANYQTGAAASADDANVTTETSYTPDGEVATLTAKNPDTGDQTTYYLYGVVEMSGSNVIIASNDLLRATIYPESVDGDDQVKYTYNRQGQTTTMTDQNGSVHSYDYDLLGRQTQDRVTNGT